MGTYLWNNYMETLRIFLASSSEIKDERDQIQLEKRIFNKITYMKIYQQIVLQNLILLDLAI